ncbi:MAG: DoxX family protein [Halioglobus sp.]
MSRLAQWYYIIHNAVFERLKYLDGLAPLAFRLYLAAVFWEAGKQKIAGMKYTIEWFGNPEMGLGLPFPACSRTWPPTLRRSARCCYYWAWPLAGSRYP